MKAITEIMSILSAMGAKPIATTDENGTTVIKVNAPKISTDERTQNNEKAEN